MQLILKNYYSKWLLENQAKKAMDMAKKVKIYRFLNTAITDV